VVSIGAPALDLPARWLYSRCDQTPSADTGAIMPDDKQLEPHGRWDVLPATGAATPMG
jgi:hypothetical protein